MILDEKVYEDYFIYKLNESEDPEDEEDEPPPSPTVGSINDSYDPRISEVGNYFEILENNN